MFNVTEAFNYYAIQKIIQIYLTGKGQRLIFTNSHPRFLSSSGSSVKNYNGEMTKDQRQPSEQSTSQPPKKQYPKIVRMIGRPLAKALAYGLPAMASKLAEQL